MPSRHLTPYSGIARAELLWPLLDHAALQHWFWDFCEDAGK